MQTSGRAPHSVSRRLAAGSVTGVIAAAAYALEQEIDRRLLRHNVDDLALLGRLLTDDRARCRLLGLGMHLVNGAVLGALYAAVAHDRLPGPPWMRGTAAALIENIALYPLALLEDRHPGIRDGHLDRYWTGTAFVQQHLRHIAFGVVLGPMTERLLARDR